MDTFYVVFNQRGCFSREHTSNSKRQHFLCINVNEFQFLAEPTVPHLPYFCIPISCIPFILISCIPLFLFLVSLYSYFLYPFIPISCIPFILISCIPLFLFLVSLYSYFLYPFIPISCISYFKGGAEP